MTTEHVSPDGRWYWDGSAWQPLPAAPAAFQQPWRMTLIRWAWVGWCIAWAIIWLPLGAGLFFPLMVMSPISLGMIALIAVRTRSDDLPPVDEHGIRR